MDRPPKVTNLDHMLLWQGRTTAALPTAAAATIATSAVGGVRRESGKRRRIITKEEVLWLDVSVDDLAGVQVPQRLTKLTDVRDGDSLGETTIGGLLECLVELTAGGPL